MRTYILLLFFPVMAYCLDYDRAIEQAHSGDWATAYQKLQHLLIDNPDAADLLYDAGVAAHNTQKYTQARAYFDRSATCACDNEVLHKKALFNAGNCCVSCGELECALDYYNKVLEHDSDDMYARHNKDVVTQMLEQKKQEQQNPDNNNQSEQNKDNQHNQNNGNGQQDQNNQENSEQSDQNQTSQENGSEQQQQTGNNQSNGNNEGQTEQGETREHDGQQPNKEETAEQGEDKKGQSEAADNQLKSQAHDTQEQKEQNHGHTPESNKNNNSSIPSNDTKDQKSDSVGTDEENAESQDSENNYGYGVKEKINDPVLMAILEEQEEKDKAMNKRLMHAKIKNNSNKGERDGW